MNETPQLLLSHHLKALKLPTFLREYDKVAQQCASEGLDHLAICYQECGRPLFSCYRREWISEPHRRMRRPSIVAVTEGFRRFRWICFDKAGVTLGQVHSEKMSFLLDTSNHDHRFTEVCLGVAWWMD